MLYVNKILLTYLEKNSVVPNNLQIYKFYIKNLQGYVLSYKYFLIIRVKSKVKLFNIKTMIIVYI